MDNQATLEKLGSQDTQYGLQYTIEILDTLNIMCNVYYIHKHYNLWSLGTLQ